MKLSRVWLGFEFVMIKYECKEWRCTRCTRCTRCSRKWFMIDLFIWNCIIWWV